MDKEEVETLVLGTKVAGWKAEAEGKKRVASTLETFILLFTTWNTVVSEENCEGVVKDAEEAVCRC
jgi:hypothetical protein